MHTLTGFHSLTIPEFTQQRLSWHSKTVTHRERVWMTKTLVNKLTFLMLIIIIHSHTRKIWWMMQIPANFIESHQDKIKSASSFPSLSIRQKISPFPSIKPFRILSAAMPAWKVKSMNRSSWCNSLLVRTYSHLLTIYGRFFLSRLANNAIKPNFSKASLLIAVYLVVTIIRLLSMKNLFSFNLLCGAHIK